MEWIENLEIEALQGAGPQTVFTDRVGFLQGHWRHITLDHGCTQATFLDLGFQVVVMANGHYLVGRWNVEAEFAQALHERWLGQAACMVVLIWVSTRAGVPLGSNVRILCLGHCPQR